MTTAFSSNTGLLTSSSGGAAMRDVLQAAGEEVMDAVRDSTKAGQLMDAVELAQNRQNHVNASGETVADVFRRLDKDGGGELDRRETRRALKELGIDPDSKLVQRQVKKFDSDGSGSLDLEEFEAFVDSILRAEDDPDSAAILEAFHNLPFMTGVSTGDRMGLVRSAEVHSFTSNQLVMAYPPAPGLGHLSFSADDVYLVLSGSARLLISLAQQCAAPPPSYLLILHHHLHHTSTSTSTAFCAGRG